MVKSITHCYKHVVNIGRSLVNYDDLIVGQQGPGQTDQLPLTDAEVLTAFDHQTGQTRSVRQYDVFQLYLCACP